MYGVSSFFKYFLRNPNHAYTFVEKGVRFVNVS